LVDIRVYADDSTDGHRRLTLLAGYMASVTQWRLFEDRWNAALQKHDVSEFHAREFFAPDGHGKYISLSDTQEHHYGEWTANQMAEFITDLTSAINNSRLRRLGASLDLEAFRALTYGERRHLTGATWNMQRQTFTTSGAPNKPYFVVWIHCLLQADEQAIPDAQILFIFDRDPAHQPRAEQHFAEIRQYFPKYRERFGGIAYRTRLEAPALQAADLFANCLCRVTADTGYLPPLRQHAVDAIFKKTGWMGIYSRDHLEVMLNSIPAERTAMQAFPDPSRVRRQPG